jgi:hypothetical protein
MTRLHLNPQAVWPFPIGQDNFRKELTVLINKHNLELGSDTPDFILADYLVDCLKVFDSAVNARTRYYV